MQIYNWNPKNIFKIIEQIYNAKSGEKREFY